MTQAGDFNSGGCAGVYVRDPLNRILNGFPVWINAEGNRFLGWDSYSMACYRLDQLEGFVAAQGFFPSYNGNQYSPDVTCCWPQYAATLTQPGWTRSTYTCGSLQCSAVRLAFVFGQPSPPANCARLGCTCRMQVTAVVYPSKTNVGP